MKQVSQGLRKQMLAAVSLTAAVTLSGCAMGNLNLSGGAGGAQSVAVKMTGLVHGGQQPVSGSTIALMTMGATGYGSAGSNLIPTGSYAVGGAPGCSSGSCQTTVVTDAGGNFTITGDYTCPTANPAAQVYLTATGGNPGLTTGTNNAAIKLVAPLGACNALSSATTVVVNEVTTAAMAFAVGQFFGTPSNVDNFGSTATAQSVLGLSNAIATYGNLVDPASGMPLGSKTLTSATGTVVVTPEQAKLALIADILAACVNSTGVSSSECTTVFSGTAASGTTVTDTLQAAVEMSLNPTSTNNGTSSMDALYGLATATSPFVGYRPAYAEPTDWTLGVTYGSNSTVNTSYLITKPEHLAVDSQGNVWLGNYAGSAATAGNSLTKLSGGASSAPGTPLAQALVGVQTGIQYVAIDPSDNVWSPQYYSATGTTGGGSSVVEYTPAGVTNTFTTGAAPDTITFDGAGNAFILEPSYKGAGELDELAYGAASGATANVIATGITTDYSTIGIDSNFTIYISGGGSATTGTGTSGFDGIWEFAKTASTTTGYPSTPTGAAVGTALSPYQTVAGVTEPEPLAIDGSNNVWFGNYGKSTLGAVSATTTGTFQALQGSPFTTTNLTAPEQIIFDGDGHLWSTEANASGNVMEYTADGVAMHPVGTSIATTGFVHTYAEPYGIAIDPSGNVWVGNYATGAAATASVLGFVTEIVGAAAPTITPLAAQLPTTAGGTNRTATRP
ncbi:MAG: hypothetical protein PW792_00130 [Acidobacteriaceae bacterium]|nr:hypothetical protein [Acidobacteriaceae bacterium]